MKTPCEVIATKVLPAVRAALVKSLTKDFGMRQLEIAHRLGITQAGVSKYLTSSRGSNQKILELFPQIDDYARKMAKKIASNKDEFVEIDLCAICKKIRRTKAFSGLYQEQDSIASCRICCYRPRKQ